MNPTKRQLRGLRRKTNMVQRELFWSGYKGHFKPWLKVVSK